jgi:glycerophosphoryl diester phosphodiesterase
MEYPDNTLDGIVAAASVCDMVEVDVRRSADGVLLLSHDPVLGGMVIAETPWELLREVDLGGGTNPPDLESVAVACPVPLNLEIKHHPWEPGFDNTYQFPLDVAERAHPGDLITSFHLGTIAAVHAAWPELRTGLIVPEQGTLAAAVEDAVSEGHAVVGAHWSLLLDNTEAKILEAHESGVEVVAWTVDDPGLASALAAAGISGIVTNDPIALIAHLGEAAGHG